MKKLKINSLYSSQRKQQISHPRFYKLNKKSRASLEAAFRCNTKAIMRSAYQKTST